MGYGKKIKEAREKSGLSQLDFAILTGVTRAYISNIEAERVSYSLKKANILLKFIGYKIEDSYCLIQLNEEE